MDPFWTYLITGGFGIGLVVFLGYFIRHMSRGD